ncbi:MAG: DsbC family protein [Kangiellaceae bacterium]|nr:DsbC family protein [Kangiellaceae bacterium]MCW9018024.1 DsbC family protein [Kangiellaceae bacterium]
MSLMRNIGVAGALAGCALLVTFGMVSRESLNHQSEMSGADNVSWENTGGALSAEELKQMLEKKLPGLEVDEIEPSPAEGYYQVFYAGELMYISENGQFIFTGNMLELTEERPINHSQRAIVELDRKRAPMRAEVLAQVDEADMVVFEAPQEKYQVTIFTDVDCAYCRKLHKEIPQLNKSGVTVRYMAYPRAGIGSGAYRKLVAVWCAEDKQAAMDDAKLRRKFGNLECQNPIAAQLNLVRKFNLSGTPAVIMDNGEIIGGYLPANEMIRLIAGSDMSASPASGR